MEEREGTAELERQTGGVLLPSSVRTGGNKSPLSISLLTALYWAHSLADKERCGRSPLLVGRTHISLRFISKLRTD